MIESFISDFVSRSPVFEAWGRFVASEIEKELSKTGFDLTAHLKIPVQLRLKKPSSIRGKIAHYNIVNLEEDLRDLVGIRLIFLLSSDVLIVENAIIASSAWKYDKVRDLSSRVKDAPESFDYQSVHYILTSSEAVQFNGREIPAGVTCEVQIRTLLQHAYAELTHDNIYKPVHVVPSNAKRYVARSMALMETTDELFCQTLEALRVENRPRNDFFAFLRKLYSETLLLVEEDVDTRTNYELIEVYGVGYDLDVLPLQVEEYWSGNDVLLEKIRKRGGNNLLFSQPVVLFLYWLIEQDDYSFKKKWPYESLLEDLREIYSNLGIAIGDF